MNIGKHLMGITLVGLLLVSVIFSGIAQAEPDRQDDESPFIHLVIELDGEVGSIAYNRASWDDFNVTNIALPGTSLLPLDYLVVSGDNGVIILCTDLEVTSRFANGSPECDEEPDTFFFTNMNLLEWTPDDTEIFMLDGSTLPEDLSDVETVVLPPTDEVNRAVETIVDLELDDDIEAYVLANALASQGLYIDAINLLQSNENLQCSNQRPQVNTDDETTVFSTPSVYIRLGEWYAIAGNEDVSRRYLECARESAEAYGDAVSHGLATARLATVTSDANEKAQLYQEAINSFDLMHAVDSVNVLLDLCGSANCARPE